MNETNQMDLYDFIAQRVKYLRKQKKLSQEALAQKSHVSNKYVSKIETQKPNISLSTLESIIDGLDVSYNTFFNFRNDSDDVQKLLDSLQSLPSEEQSQLTEAFQLILDSRMNYRKNLIPKKEIEK